MNRAQRITRDALTSLLASRSRALLMMLGPAAAVAVLSTVIVTTQGAREQVMALVSKHSLDMLMVRAGAEVQIFAPRADRGLAVLFEDDARAIEAEIAHVRMVSPVQNQRGIEVVVRDRVVTTRAFGVDSDWMVLRRWGMAEGEFLSDADLAVAGRVVMLGAKVARDLFPEGGAVGQTVRVANDPYTVKGVFIEMGASAGGDDWDDRIVVPFTTSARRLLNRPYLEQIVLRVDDVSRVRETAERVRALLRTRHNIGPGEADDFFVREPEDVERAAVETSSALRALLVAVSIIAQVAGGLATANLMLTGVSQRVHEIGLRRAAGAREADITRQFLTECVVVSLGGGILGTAIGVAVALGLSAAGLASSRITWVPFGAALLASVTIGVAAGLHPARKAARLDPAKSVREQPV
ncbi:MAG TPA: ABC transporter permease [Gemmatimonadaceae bacterium]|nr:ABC transporter permease [Gemmatimonadaceae bacterium]